MVKLVSSINVPAVTPAQDPGVSIPAGAFKSGVEIASEQLTPVLFEAQLRLNNRRDTVDRSKKINQYNTETDETLRKFNLEKDLSSEDVLQEYATFLNKRSQELLREHQGTDDSRARLEVRLQDIASAAQGRANSQSVALGREEALKTFNDGLDPIIARVASNPTRETIDEAFLDVEVILDDARGSFDPTEENLLLRDRGRELVALGALDTLLNLGRTETAAALLDEGNLASALSPDTAIDMRRRILITQTSQDDATKAGLAVREKLRAALQREPTEEEIQRKLDIDDPASRRDQEISGLMARGATEEFAVDVTDGNVRVVGPDQFGQFFSANVVTDEIKLLSEQDQATVSGAVSQPDQQAQPSQQPKQPAKTTTQPTLPRTRTKKGTVQKVTPETSLEQAISQGTGPFAKIRAGISNVIGPLMIGKAINLKTTDARLQLRLFNQFAKSAVVNNPRFPKFEQELVAKFLPDVDVFFKDPDTGISDMRRMRDEMIVLRDAKDKELGGPKITAGRQGELFDQISKLNEILSLMEAPIADDTAAATGEPQRPDDVPEGSTFLGNSIRGNPVWLTPDDRKLEVVP